MQAFKNITQAFLNHVLQTRFNDTHLSQKEQNTVFKFTSISQNQIFEDWMTLKFNEFIAESFYPGIQLKNSQKQSKENALNSQLWQLYNLEQKSQNSTSKIQFQSKNQKCQSSKIYLDGIHKIVCEQKHEKSQQIQIQEKKKSFILRIYSQNANNYENISSSYIVDWSKPKLSASNDKIKPSISLVNPCLSAIKQIQLQYCQICYAPPECIILTSSSLSNLLSTISLTHLIFYLDLSQRSFSQMSSGPNQLIKIITTKQIYQKYLELFTFIRLISSFIETERQLINSLKSLSMNSQNNEGVISELSTKYESYVQINSSVIKNKLHYVLSNYHFHIVKPNQHFTFNKIQFCIRNHNILPYQTYDLEVFDSSDGKFLALIQQNNLKNVKNIYFTHKKGYICEELYLNAIKRLQQKQNLYKSKTNVTIFASIDCSSILKEIDLLSLKPKKFIKKNSLLTDVKKKSEPQTQIIYNDPYAIPIDKKNKIFAQMRKIEEFTLLSDIEIQSITHQGVFLQLKKNQVIFNPTMKFQHLYVVLDGVCRLQNKFQSSTHFIRSRNLFGWEEFLTDENQQIRQKKELKQKETLLTVHSARATVLRIQLNFLNHLLFDKIQILKKTRQIHISSLLDKIISLKYQNNKFIKESQERFETLKQKCSLPNPYQINFTQDLDKNNTLKVLLANYPNLTLIF